MLEDRIASRPSLGRGRLGLDHVHRAIDQTLLRALGETLQRYGAGRLDLTLPSGATARLGDVAARSGATLHVHRYRAVWSILRAGSIGFAQSYMDGDIDTDDLKRLFDFYCDNEAAITAALPSLLTTRSRDRLYHATRRNTRAGSRRNISAHYDLGNAFYSLWLDPSMLYSSGIYRSPDDSLEQAQNQKLDRIVAALDLRTDRSLLEIGCGWGALAEACARHGAKVDAITISKEQLAAAKARIAAAGLSERVDVRYEDYRDTAGIYDRLVSIEMIEAIGEKNWPLYFQKVAERLAPSGVAVIQAITIREDAFARYRRNPDFIQRYIFPGGMLPTVELMRSGAGDASLEFEVVERFGQSYALTLREWRRRFEMAWPRIEALGFDQRFRRMWLYYLTYCEVGFERGSIDVGLYRLRKPA